MTQKELSELRKKTLKELSQLRYLRIEIARNNKKLRELESKTPLPGQNLTGMPKGGSTQDSISRYVEDKDDLRAIILAQNIQLIHEEKRLTRFIEEIPDSKIRDIFTFYFVDGLKWEDVAAKMNECVNSWKNLSNICYRYIDKINKSKS